MLDRADEVTAEIGCTTDSKKTAVSDSTEMPTMDAVGVTIVCRGADEPKSRTCPLRSTRQAEANNVNRRGGTKIRVDNLHYEVSERDLHVSNTVHTSC